MALYANEREVSERVGDLRRDHASLRAEVACRIALAQSYSNGRQWNEINRNEYDDLTETPLDEDYDPHSQEMRVTDNKIAPLVRQAKARTKATRIEAHVTPPRHQRGIDATSLARVSQNTLNGLDESIGMTRAARHASDHRWLAGSSLIVALMSQKGNEVSADVATYPDGSPISINDQWVRWQSGCLCDLIWEPWNLSPDLNDHSVLIYEQILTVRRFTQIYGPLDQFGIKADHLPTIAQLAPHYGAAGNIGGTNLFTNYKSMSTAKAIRASMLIESDPKDPTFWPEMYLILETNPTSGSFGSPTDMTVTNIDNPRNPYGHHGRPIFKLDAFTTGDSVWSWGLPSILMTDQDMVNILRSLEFQQLTNVIHGMWLVDTRTQSREKFSQDLAQGIGGILTYNSAQDARPPQWVTPQTGVANSEFVTLIGELSMGMDGKAHISQAMKGAMKTHVPEDLAKRAFEEGGVVFDDIVQSDKITYSDALKTTLGTIRRVAERPNRMLARLRQQHGFTSTDLATLLDLDPRWISLNVMVREQSIVQRSVQERMMKLNESLALGVISPEEYVLEMADELERPVTAAQGREIHFLRTMMNRIMDGSPFNGLPGVDFNMFLIVARSAQYGVDLQEQDGLRRYALIERAIEVQRQIALEQTAQSQGLSGEAGGSQSIGSPQLPGEEFSSVPPVQGAPESINPLTAPTGAAGGLPAGLPAAVA